MGDDEPGLEDAAILICPSSSPVGSTRNSVLVGVGSDSVHLDFKTPLYHSLNSQRYVNNLRNSLFIHSFIFSKFMENMFCVKYYARTWVR